MTPERYISEAIDASGLTISKAAKAAGVSYQTLWRCLRAGGRLKPHVYLTLCAFFSLDPRGYREAGTEEQ